MLEREVRAGHASDRKVPQRRSVLARVLSTTHPNYAYRWTQKKMRRQVQKVVNTEMDCLRSLGWLCACAVFTCYGVNLVDAAGKHDAAASGSGMRRHRRTASLAAYDFIHSRNEAASVSGSRLQPPRDRPPRTAAVSYSRVMHPRTASTNQFASETSGEEPGESPKSTPLGAQLFLNSNPDRTQSRSPLKLLVSAFSRLTNSMKFFSAQRDEDFPERSADPVSTGLATLSRHRRGAEVNEGYEYLRPFMSDTGPLPRRQVYIADPKDCITTGGHKLSSQDETSVQNAQELPPGVSKSQTDSGRTKSSTIRRAISMGARDARKVFHGLARRKVSEAIEGEEDQTGQEKSTVIPTSKYTRYRSGSFTLWNKSRGACPDRKQDNASQTVNASAEVAGGGHLTNEKSSHPIPIIPPDEPPRRAQVQWFSTPDVNAEERVNDGITTATTGSRSASPTSGMAHIHGVHSELKEAPLSVSSQAVSGIRTLYNTNPSVVERPSASGTRPCPPRPPVSTISRQVTSTRGPLTLRPPPRDYLYAKFRRAEAPEGCCGRFTSSSTEERQRMSVGSQAEGFHPPIQSQKTVWRVPSGGHDLKARGSGWNTSTELRHDMVSSMSLKYAQGGVSHAQ